MNRPFRLALRTLRRFGVAWRFAMWAVIFGPIFDKSGITSEAVFRPIHASGRIVQLSARVGLWPQYIEKVVKKMMTRAGIDHKGYGAHSLRSGFVTQASLLGKTEAEIMRHTGHATEHMVRRYIRVAELQKFNATKGMGI